MTNIEFHLFSEDGKEQVQKVQLKQRILVDNYGEAMGWQVNPFRDVFCTMGVKELADKNEAWWLLDHIAFAQDDENVKALDFQAWILTVKGSKADIVCHDGNENEVYSHHFYITDYPAPGVELWLERTDRSIILLPEEH